MLDVTDIGLKSAGLTCLAILGTGVIIADISTCVYNSLRMTEWQKTAGMRMQQTFLGKHFVHVVVGTASVICSGQWTLGRLQAISVSLRWNLDVVDRSQ